MFIQWNKALAKTQDQKIVKLFTYLCDLKEDILDEKSISLCCEVVNGGGILCKLCHEISRLRIDPNENLSTKAIIILKNQMECIVRIEQKII